MKKVVYLLVGWALVACASGRGGRGKPQVANAENRASTCECPCARQNAQAKAASAQQPGPTQDPYAAHATAAVPVTAQDPTWGSPDAPVTMVEFSDFQCPFCARVVATLDQLERDYGPDRLRIVWKNYPLPFHPYARPAAQAAATVFALGGSQAFWRFHDMAFADAQSIGPESFSLWATRAGLSAADFERAFVARQGQPKVDADLALGRRLSITGTPSFLINGVSLDGAQPIEAFKAIIDAQLEAAKVLVAAGLAAHAVYPTLCAKNLAAEPPGEAPPGEDPTALVHKHVDDPGKDNPSRGNPDAPVTVQVFGDFECPFCQRVLPTLAEIEHKYPGRIRVVWRNYPLPMHSHAALAAEAAQEAFAQQGSAGFWRFHDLLFASQATAGLDRPNLERLAKRIGLDMRRFKAALDSHRHRAAVERDVAAAVKAQIRGTPAFVINDYYVGGAQPVAVFDQVVSRILGP